MRGIHWITLVIGLLVGYVFARYYPQLGQQVGLP